MPTQKQNSVWKPKINLNDVYNRLKWKSAWTKPKAKLKEFCKNTSIKGIPRILTSEEKYLKVLWVIAVIAFLSTALFQTYILLYKYFQYTTVLRQDQHYIAEDHTEFMISWFPSMTICDLQYSLKDMEEKIAKDLQKVSMPSDYFQFFYQFYQKWAQMCAQSNYCEARHPYPAHISYMESIGGNILYSLSLSVNEFLFHCEILSLGLYQKKLDCTDLVNITVIPNFDYQTCIRIDINTENGDKLYKNHGESVYGMRLALMASRDVALTQPSGGILYHHSAGKQPSTHLDRSFVTLSPGQHYTVRHEEELMLRLNSTKQHCIDVSHNHYYSLGGEKVNYSTVSYFNNVTISIFFFFYKIVPLAMLSVTLYVALLVLFICRISV